MKYLLINGRESHLAKAELESLMGPSSIRPVNKYATLVRSELDFQRIGSSIKYTEILSESKSQDVKKLILESADLIESTRSKRSGKLQLGVSVYSDTAHLPTIRRSVLELKKVLRSRGLSVRVIPNKTAHLNAAQVLRNKLTKDENFEIAIITSKKASYICKTLAVQDIDEYTDRDRNKPVRDSVIGMLPPKLAQTLINIANPKPSATLLDPFCGSGTVLMEALLMGFQPFGSDISPAMVDASIKNTEWLRSKEDLKTPQVQIELADATRHTWNQEINSVVCETYLGPPLRSLPENNELARIIEEVDDLHRRFFMNVATQIPSGTTLAVAVPSWSTDSGFLHLPVLDDLKELGYNLMSFEHVNQDLLYHRKNQVVARHILGLIRK